MDLTSGFSRIESHLQDIRECCLYASSFAEQPVHADAALS